jgi:LytS/YehU family sensor histidine kinase
MTTEANFNPELSRLKDQVCPHFLFNCFNSLSSLILEDRERANRFLTELSKVYRYLLHNNHDVLTMVEQETRFIRSYYHLLEARYSHIYLNIDINNRYDQYQLPTLTLQLLVENAVKHNIIQHDRPLFIDIFMESPGILTVRNNKQEKITRWPSTGTGLNNIQRKYRLLNHKGIDIINDSTYFTVIVPLLDKKA